MDRVSENPLKGLANDVPISNRARIEIDIRRMLDETDLAQAITALEGTDVLA